MIPDYVDLLCMLFIDHGYKNFLNNNCYVRHDQWALNNESRISINMSKIHMCIIIAKAPG